MVVIEVGFPRPNFTGLKKYLAFSLPQIPGKILLWLIISSDRYFITHFINLSETGVYSSSHTLANLTSLFYMPISFVLYPVVSRLWEQKRISEVKSYLENSTRVFLMLSIPAAAGIALLSQPLLRVLTTPEFLAGNGLVLLLAVGTIFLGIYNINVNVILLVMKTKLLPLVIAIASATSVLMNFVLIPRLGILGAGVSNIVAYFVLAAIVTFWAKNVIHYRIDFILTGKVIAATLIMSVCLYFLRVDSVWKILLAIVVGAIVFGSVFILLKGLSAQDKQLIRRFVRGLIPGISKKIL
jgi:O-antigen/teichoic acid export membrane protein